MKSSFKLSMLLFCILLPRWVVAEGTPASWVSGQSWGDVWKMAHKHAERLEANAHAAEDIAQDALTNLLRRGNTLATLPADELTRYVCTSVKHARIDYYRKIYSEKLRLQLLAPRSQALNEALEEVDVREKIASISKDKDRKIITMRYQGHTNREVAKKLKVSERKVRYRLGKIKKRFSRGRGRRLLGPLIAIPIIFEAKDAFAKFCDPPPEWRKDRAESFKSAPSPLVLQIVNTGCEGNSTSVPQHSLREMLDNLKSGSTEKETPSNRTADDYTTLPSSDERYKIRMEMMTGGHRSLRNGPSPKEDGMLVYLAWALRYGHWIQIIMGVIGIMIVLAPVSIAASRLKGEDAD